MRWDQITSSRSIQSSLFASLPDHKQIGSGSDYFSDELNDGGVGGMNMGMAVNVPEGVVQLNGWSKFRVVGRYQNGFGAE